MKISQFSWCWRSYFFTSPQHYFGCSTLKNQQEQRYLDACFDCCNCWTSSPYPADSSPSSNNFVTYTNRNNVVALTTTEQQQQQLSSSPNPSATSPSLGNFRHPGYYSGGGGGGSDSSTMLTDLNPAGRGDLYSHHQSPGLVNKTVSTT